MARIFGLDLGTYSIKAVGLSTTLRGYQVTGFWEQKLPPLAEGQTLDQVQAEAARSILHSNRLHPDTIVCGVGGGRAITRLLHLPFTDKKKLEQVVPFEVGEQLPYDLEEVILDHQVVATRESGSDVLVAAMRKPDFSAFVETFKAAGADPRIVCLDTLPLLYLANVALAGEVGPFAIVDLGHTFTSLTIIGEGGLQFVRTLGVGGLAVTQAIARTLGVDLAQAEEVKHQGGGWNLGVAEVGSQNVQVRVAQDAALRPLIGDLRQTLQAHAAQKRGRVEKIFLCGGSSRLHGIDSMLAANLGVEVHTLEPLKGPFASFAGPNVPADILPKALGLGLRAFSSGRGPQMNLRTGEFGFRGDFQYLRGRVIQLAVGIVAILALVCVYIGVRYSTLSSYAGRQEALLRVVTKQTLGEEVTEFTTAHDRITRGGAKAALGELLPRTTALDYLMEISKNVGKEKIDVKRIDIGNKRISLEGEIDTIADLDSVVQSLEKFKCFAPPAGKDERNVRITKSGKNQLNNRANFQLLITPSC
jgi:general secretion pathway protein L